MDRKGNLVITRHPGESFTIGDDITITVLAGSHNNVRLSVEAPLDLAIIRDNAIKKQPKTI